MKVAVITCYKQPDYVRAQTLRAAVAATEGNQLIVIKNTHKGLLRYPEVILKVIAARLLHRPECYILTFRGYEMLPAINLLTWPKRLIFDEFINPLQWLHEPRPEAWARFVPKKILRSAYRLLLRRPLFILADTTATAQRSAELTYGDGASGKFRALPVSTDESLFHPTDIKKDPGTIFKVFYYGNMLPLHGIEHVLSAAVILAKLPIEFNIVGGKKDTALAVRHAVEQGAHIHYRDWVDYARLPNEIHAAHLCLGGPFGNTAQANLVVTGKTYQFLACAAPTLIGKTLATEGFEHKRNCLMAPLGDAEALAKQIRWAYEHQAELETIGAQGRLLYEERFSIAAIAPQLQAILSMQSKHNQK